MRRITTFVFFVFFFLGGACEAAAEVRMKNVNAPDTFRLHEYPRSAPTARFKNAKGNMTSLADFKGKILLVNIWSTGCPQCVVELPMLDRLQKDMGGLKFQVIALASGGDTLSVVRRVWGERNISRLEIFADEDASFSKAAGVLGLPTTLLLDERGQELGRIRGMAEWDGPTIKAQIRGLIRKAKERPPEPQALAGSVPEKPAESDVPPPPDRTHDFSGWFKR